jgi:hypothetical protein
MHKAWVKAVDLMFKAGGQIRDLCYSSTSPVVFGYKQSGSYTALNTGFAQYLDSSTQGLKAVFNLFFLKFYPVSTIPMTNTNLIKE